MKNGIITPIYEREHLCPHCLKKLSWRQWRQIKKGRSVVCKKCGGTVKINPHIVH